MLDGPELAQYRFPVVNRKSILHKEIGDGIDVAADSACAQLCRLPDSRATAHERIENDRVRDADRLIEQAKEIDALRRERADDHRAEHGAEPLRPPFVNMIRRPVDFLSPALDFGNVAQHLEGKAFVLDRPRTVPDGKRKNHRSGMAQWKLRLMGAEPLRATEAGEFARQSHRSLFSIRLRGQRYDG